MEEKKIYVFYDSDYDYRHNTDKKHYYKLTEKRI